MSKYFRTAAILLTAAAAMLIGTASVSAAEQTDDISPCIILPEDDYSEGWITFEGKHYYMQADGTLAMGETTIDGVPYLFGYSGALKTDWQTVAGKRYYYDPATGTPVFGWVSYFGSYYYVSEDTGKLTDFCEIDGERYYFGTDGMLRQGAFFYDDMLYCSDPESGALGSGIHLTDDGIYCTDGDGIALSGWQEERGSRYYFDPQTGRGYNDGFAEIDGVCYYFSENGVMATNFLYTEDGTLYCFAEDGSMYCGGLTEVYGKIYYFQTDGSAAMGWYTVDGTEYYFQENGAMACDVTLSLDGYLCTFDEDGILIKRVTDEIRLEVPDYKQFDEEWGSEALGSSTLKSSGCLVTAMAMLHSYTTSADVTPVTMRDMLAFTGGGALASWADITDLGYTVETYESCAVTETILEHVFTQLREGKPVVMGCKNSSGGQHYVTIIGYTGDGNSFTADLFLMNDPGSSKRYVLSEYLALFPRLYKLIY